MLNKLKWIIAKSFIGKYLSDKTFLQIKYERIMREKLNLNSPIGFNEKIQWLKLHYRSPLLTTLVDKFEVKNYVAEKIGAEYVIPNYGIWESFDDIDFKRLPSQFVLKTTHDCGGVILCTDKNGLDLKKTKSKLEKHLKNNHYYKNREWAYKDVEPRIIAERYFTNKRSDNEIEELVDYKIFCFDGEPKIIQISTGRFNSGLKHNFYDINFQKLDIVKYKGGTEEDISKPENFELMLLLAKKLSSNLPFVRADFYNIEGRVFFGELTFYPGGGFSPFKPKEWEERVGNWIKLKAYEN
ncbi:MAG: ATP-grasp fold amidoligase family protein [Myroides sp.]|nr:ATP-grasp fold amidoligase family protein [Myroides sp.]